MNYLIVLAKTLLCSKFHCQKGFDLILFPHEIVPTGYGPRKVDDFSTSTVHFLTNVYGPSTTKSSTFGISPFQSSVIAASES